MWGDELTIARRLQTCFRWRVGRYFVLSPQILVSRGYVYTEMLLTENTNFSLRMHMNAHENVFNSKTLSKVETFENATNETQTKCRVNAAWKRILSGVVYAKSRYSENHLRTLVEKNLVAEKKLEAVQPRHRSTQTRCLSSLVASCSIESTYIDMAYITWAQYCETLTSASL